MSKTGKEENKATFFQKYKKFVGSYYFTIHAFLEIVRICGIAVIILGLIFILIFLIGGFHLIDLSTIVSLILVEVPLSVILYFFLGEGRRSTLSETLDRIEIAEKNRHLRLHYWNLLWRFQPYFTVENTVKHTAFDAPKYMVNWGKLGMLEQIKHKSEIAMRAYFDSQIPKITLVNKDATPRDLLA